MRQLAAATSACLALLLASCGHGDATGLRNGPSPVANTGKDTGHRDDLSALNDFAEEPAPTGPPSYEVAIASAAADQSQGMDACAEKPVAERAACRREVQATWEKAAAEAMSNHARNQP